MFSPPTPFKRFCNQRWVLSRAHCSAVDSAMVETICSFRETRRDTKARCASASGKSVPSHIGSVWESRYSKKHTYSRLSTHGGLCHETFSQIARMASTRTFWHPGANERHVSRRWLHWVILICGFRCENCFGPESRWAFCLAQASSFVDVGLETPPL